VSRLVKISIILRSKNYVIKKNIIRYREKAAKDAEDVLGRSQQLLKQAGRQDISILEEDVRLFCKESHNLRVIRGYPLFEELRSTPNAILQELGKLFLAITVWVIYMKSIAVSIR